MKKHMDVVGGVIFRDGCVLAAKRGEAKYAYVAHKYEFAGGKIEKGETPEEALVREFMEELGAAVRVTGHFMTVEHEYPDFTITLRTYECVFESSFTCLEHESLDWIPVERLNPETWAPADAPVVEKILRETSGDK